MFSDGSNGGEELGIFAHAVFCERICPVVHEIKQPLDPY